MKKFLCVITIGLAFTASFRGQQGATPTQAKQCDEATKRTLWNRLQENYRGNPEQQEDAYEAAKEFVCLCADDDDYTKFARKWLRQWKHSLSETDAHASMARQMTTITACRCDELRKQLYERSIRGNRHPEDQMEYYEEAKRFLRICEDGDDAFTLSIKRWVEKYDAAVREYEARRAAAETGGKLGAFAAAALTKGLTSTR